MPPRFLACVALAFFVSSPLRAADIADVQALLAREIIGPRLALEETKLYVDARVPRMPKVTTRAEWEHHARCIRIGVLARVVYKGTGIWRDHKGGVDWLGDVKGGPGYRVRKLRYEALPGLWIPALLYEPEKLDGKAPAALAVNGHEPVGKAADYKQIRCINMAKRGMIVLNPEWLGMGQLRAPGYAHGHMNQLDLCGASGLAPFYLGMKHGLDILLEHKNADPTRVCVSGLSGGGWQTILISALDTRVTLANPVAGYSGVRTRLAHFKDLGDSEQTPNDLAVIADYTHLTALMAPRPTLLTYNAKDDCCFESGYALPPLLDAARPVFALYGKEDALRSHVNRDPGDHNFGKDNRQALYRMIGAHFFAADKGFNADEIPTAGEVRTKEELDVELPKNNADFNSLALGLAKSLPRVPALPGEANAARRWQEEQRKRLGEIVEAAVYEVKAEKIGTREKNGMRATSWKLRTGDAWTVPAVELVQGEPKGTTLLVADGGRAAAAEAARKLLAAGQRVLAIDPWYFGESRLEQRDWLFALLVATVGGRPLGVQASQVTAAARWGAAEYKGPVAVVAVGPRASLFALVAAALETKAIRGVELHGSRGSLKEVLEQNLSVEQMPEQFCFGLLEALDVKQMAALVAPRPLRFGQPSKRVKEEMAGLKTWYATLGGDGDPLR